MLLVMTVVTGRSCCNRNRLHEHREWPEDDATSAGFHGCTLASSMQVRKNHYEEGKVGRHHGLRAWQHHCIRREPLETSNTDWRVEGL